ncbi:MAG TPA: tetratricopeptide repeat protein [Micromonosporaceae bacterium]|nr:tetratricopeptide repeat protein [Micromonosporaceae bacterium]
MQLNLDELTAQAHALVDAGDLVGARELLDRALSDADPNPAYTTPELAEAADLYARVLVALGAPQEARKLASYAYSAATRLYGSDDQRTLAAGTALAAILYRVGTHGSRQLSARLYQSLIEELSAVEGPESQRVLYANADLAVLEHLRGESHAALDRMDEAWTQHSEVFGENHPGGIRMLARLGAMERDSGLPELAVEHLALARALSRAHLGSDHPLVAQLTAFMAGSAGQRLRDAEGAPLNLGADAPPAVPPQRIPYDDAAGVSAEPAYSTQAWPPLIADPLTDDLPFRGEQPPWFVEESGVAAEPEVAPDQPAATAAPTGAAAGATAGAAAGAAYAEAAREPARPARGWERVRTWRVVRQRRPRSEQALFVPRRGDQGLLPVVIAVLVVVLLGTIAIAAGVALFNDGRADPVVGRTVAPVVTVSPQITTVAPNAPAPTTVVAPPPADAPPTGFAINDTRDAVTLNWTYPAGATGPVVISAGLPGREPRVISERPAGTNSYVVHGLPRDTNFCFSVGVRYDAATLSEGPTVCTARAGG